MTGNDAQKPDPGKARERRCNDRGERKNKVKTLRSRAGCITCRNRRVKCNEIRPRCAPCTRLGRDCIWAPRWSFRNVTGAVHREYSTAGWSRADALEVSCTKWETLVRAWHVNLNNHFRPEYLHDLGYGAASPSACPIGTFVAVLTPESFARLPEYGGDLSGTVTEPLAEPTMHMTGPQLSQLDCGYEEHLQLATSTSADYTMYNSTTEPWLLPPVKSNIPLEHDMEDGDVLRHMLFYEKVVSTTIMPFVTKYGFNIDSKTGGDVIVAAAADFPPLRHAICAITLLSSAMRGGPSLLGGAFHHYDQAISACLEHTDIYSSRFFYLHYLLLKFDVSCPTHGCPRDPRLAARHLEQLRKILQNQPKETFETLQGYLSWSIVSFDAQSAMIGNEEAGSYVESMLDNTDVLPENIFNFTPPAADGCLMFPRVNKLLIGVAQLIGRISREAFRMRTTLGKQTPTPTLLADVQARVNVLSVETTQFWTERCPAELQDVKNFQAITMSPVALATFKHARLQFAVLTLYLYTSMYPLQRLHSPPHVEPAIASLCTQILLATASAVRIGEVELYSIPGLFLAGVMSRVESERRAAQALHEMMRDGPMESSANRSLALMKGVQTDQESKIAQGGRLEDVDWVEFVREREVNHLSLF